MSQIKINFYGEIVLATLPDEYHSFKILLSNLFLLDSKDVYELEIHYMNQKRKKVRITNPFNYYNALLFLLTSNEKEIFIEVSETSRLYLREFASSKLEISKKMNDLKKDDTIENLSQVFPQTSQEERRKESSEEVDIINGFSFEQDQMKQILNHPINKRTNEAIHHCICNRCSVTPIIGIRYKCMECDNFDLCEDCEGSIGEIHGHSFVKIRKPESIEPDESRNMNENIDINSYSERDIDFHYRMSNLINNGVERRDPPKYRYLLKVARLNYDLFGISDDALLEALEETKGDINHAVCILLSK